MKIADFFDELLTEAVRPNHLYHGTSIENFYEILEADELAARTAHSTATNKDWAIRPKDVNKLVGVSLTRDLAFARRWSTRTPSWNKGVALQGVVLVLDGAAIRRDFRMMQVSFWGGAGASFPSELARSGADEFEEFVVGSIKPLSRYLVECQVREDILQSNDLLTFAAEERGVRLRTF